MRYPADGAALAHGGGGHGRRPVAGARIRTPLLPPSLSALARRLWVPEGTAEWPVVVTAGPLPATHVAVESYSVVPGYRRPRFLVPVGAPAAVEAAFTRHLTTPSPAARALGLGLALGSRTSAFDRLFTDRLVVGVDRRVGSKRYADWLLLHRLATELGTGELVAVHPVRRAVPASKPTLRLFSRRGEALGHAKIGWSRCTRAMVDNEAAALRALAGGVPEVRVPRALSAGRWQDRAYLVATPLPPGLRPWRTEPELMPDALLRVADTGACKTGPLAHSSYLAGLRSRLQNAAAAEPCVTAVLRAWLERLARQQTRLRFGRWHGDWVAWNLAGLDGDAYSWDWEYSDPSVPVGFDLLHWHFQHRLAQADGTVETATRRLDEVTPQLSAMAVPAPCHGLTASLYLLEMLTRATVLAAHGNGWNPKLYPSLLRVADNRDR